MSLGGVFRLDLAFHIPKGLKDKPRPALVNYLNDALSANETGRVCRERIGEPAWLPLQVQQVAAHYFVASAFAASSPTARENFLPLRRTSLSDFVPSPLSFTTAASLGEGRLRSTI